MRCLGEAGPGLGKALQETDCLGMVLLQPSQGHRSRARIRAGMCRRDRSRPGRGAPGVGSHLSHPCALRVLPRLPRALISALRSPRSRARVLAKPRNGHSSPAGKISMVWVGWDAGGTFPTPCWEGAEGADGFFRAHSSGLPGLFLHRFPLLDSPSSLLSGSHFSQEKTGICELRKWKQSK